MANDQQSGNAVGMDMEACWGGMEEERQALGQHGETGGTCFGAR